MGLDLIVGIRAAVVDDAGSAWLASMLERTNRFLALAGMPPHDEPRPTEEPWSVQMWGYGGLHDLRRLAAYLRAGLEPEPLRLGEDATEDPVLGRYYGEAGWDVGPDGLSTLATGGGPERNFDHLVFHGDAEGIYLPRAFEPVLLTYEEGDAMIDAIGSSATLRTECEVIARWLGLDLSRDPEDEEILAVADTPALEGARWRRFGVESFSCLRLHHACGRSLAGGQALVFG